MRRVIADRPLPAEVRRWCEVPGTGAAEGWEPPVCSENPALSLEEQPALLTLSISPAPASCLKYSSITQNCVTYPYTSFSSTTGSHVASDSYVP